MLLVNVEELFPFQIWRKLLNRLEMKRFLVFISLCSLQLYIYIYIYIYTHTYIHIHTCYSCGTVSFFVLCCRLSQLCWKGMERMATEFSGYWQRIAVFTTQIRWFTLAMKLKKINFANIHSGFYKSFIDVGSLRF